MKSALVRWVALLGVMGLMVAMIAYAQHDSVAAGPDDAGESPPNRSAPVVAPPANAPFASRFRGPTPPTAPVASGAPNAATPNASTLPVSSAPVRETFDPSAYGGNTRPAAPDAYAPRNIAPPSAPPVAPAATLRVGGEPTPTSAEAYGAPLPTTPNPYSAPVVAEEYPTRPTRPDAYRTAPGEFTPESAPLRPAGEPNPFPTSNTEEAVPSANAQFQPGSTTDASAYTNRPTVPRQNPFPTSEPPAAGNHPSVEGVRPSTSPYATPVNPPVNATTHTPYGAPANPPHNTPANYPPSEYPAANYPAPSVTERPLSAFNNPTDQPTVREADVQNTSAAAQPASEGIGLPGAKNLEGQQTPSLSIHKMAPAEMKVGQMATIEMTIRNLGSAPAQHVELRDDVPKGTRFVDAVPSPRMDARGQLVWNLNTLQPGDEIKVQMRVMPQAEGEVGSVARITFTADASSRSVVTRPQLVVAVQGGGRVMIQEDAKLNIRISNPGTGTATGVILRDLIPEGLDHPAGAELEYEIGDLAPGESRDIELNLKAVRAGRLLNQLDAYAEGGLRSKPVNTEITVVAPSLEVAANGPTRRYLERPAVYTLSVSNPGTAPAKQIALTAHLPDGFEFVKADNAGRYDPQTRTVQWLLDELPPERTGNVTLTTLPIEPGVKQLKVEANAAQGLTAQGEREVLIEGVAAVLFQLADVADPIEIGGETAYEIRVVNQGSKTSTNVRLVAFVPEQMQVLHVEGPTRYQAGGGRVVFDPIPRLAPKADTLYRIKLRGAAAGDVRFRVQLITDEMTSPVTKEESTRIFGDE